MARPTTFLVVDDHQSFAQLLAGALDSVPDFRCVGTANSAAEGLDLVRLLRPDVVVMDIQMPTVDGLTATRRIHEIAPETLVAVVTAHRDPDWVSRAAHAGATAFVPKDVPLAEMIDVLSHLKAGQVVVAPSTFAGLLPEDQMPQAVPRPDLTQREQEVLRLLGRGEHLKGIAHALGISLHTCRGYIKSLHTKLGVSSQLEAVLKAQQMGLIDAGSQW